MNIALTAKVPLQTSVGELIGGLIAGVFLLYILAGIPVDVFLLILHMYQNGSGNVTAYFRDPVSDYLRFLPLSLALNTGWEITMWIRRFVIRLLAFVDQNDESGNEDGTDTDLDAVTDQRQSVIDDSDTQVYKGEE